MEKLGERELDIMQALWRLKKATVGDVVQEISREQGEIVAYTTVQTMLNRLEIKKLVARDDSERTHRYYAVLQEPKVARGAIKRLTDRFFRGSAEELVSHLVEKDLTDEELARIQSLINDQREQEKKK